MCKYPDIYSFNFTHERWRWATNVQLVCEVQGTQTAEDDAILSQNLNFQELCRENKTKPPLTSLFFCMSVYVVCLLSLLGSDLKGVYSPGGTGWLLTWSCITVWMHNYFEDSCLPPLSVCMHQKIIFNTETWRKKKPNIKKTTPVNPIICATLNSKYQKYVWCQLLKELHWA